MSPTRSLRRIQHTASRRIKSEPYLAYCNFWNCTSMDSHHCLCFICLFLHLRRSGTPPWPVAQTFLKCRWCFVLLFLFGRCNAVVLFMKTLNNSRSGKKAMKLCELGALKQRSCDISALLPSSPAIQRVRKVLFGIVYERDCKLAAWVSYLGRV